MSFILDALRRADSETASGDVPGLHAQPTASQTQRPRRARKRPLTWILGGGAIGVLATLAVWFVMRPPMPSSAGGTTASDGAPVTGAAAPATGPATAAPATAAPAAPAAASAPTESARVPATDPMAPVAQPAPWPAAKPAPAAVAADGGKATPSKQAPGQPPGQAPIVARDALPANLKGELPALAVGGSMYSSVPANRTLILDGRLVRENERLTPELVLEEIRLKSAVLRYKGHRFEIGY